MHDHRKTKKQLIEELEAQRQETARLSRELAQRHEEPAAAQRLDQTPQAKTSRQRFPDNRERYRSLVDNSIDGIITIDERGIVESFNPAAEQIFGYSEAEIIGQNVHLLMSEPFRSHHDQYLADYLRTGRQKVIGIGRQVEGRRRDGTVFAMDLAVSEFHLGERRMFTGFIRDLTERKQLEAQLLQAQKMESIGQLAGGIAHDFNNQLGIILFDVDLLLAGSDRYLELRDDLLKIRKVVLRGANLARQLLLFSRRQQMKPQTIDLNHHVQELRKMLGRLLGERIQVELQLGENPWRISADPGNIDQVILNLAINGRDAMPDGGRLYFETENLEIDEEHCRQHSQAHQGRFVCLRVKDNGSGMSDEVRLRIFEPFFTTKEEGKGTGLGLSVVYGIVQAHGGWIEVVSQPGRGSDFSIYLPALKDEKQAGKAVQSVPGAKQQGNGERILLLAAEPELRERMRSTLVANGYRVNACRTVAEAGSLFRQTEGRFELIVSDLLLTDGRSSELIFQLLGARPELAALLLSENAEENIDGERIRREQLPVLQKPFALSHLLTEVRAALDRRAADQGEALQRHAERA